MNLRAIQRLLKKELSVKSHLDEVPKNAKYPAVSYRHQAHSSAMLLNAKKSGRSDTWLISIQTKNDDDIEKLVKELENLDNLTNEDYQRVFVRLGTTINKQEDETIRTTTATLQTYLWS